MQRIVLLSLLFGLCAALTLESASAQILRRQLQRIPGIPSEPGYRVGPTLRQEPIIQGDGQAVGRVLNIVRQFTGNNGELKPVIIISFASFDEFRRIIQIVAQQIRLDKGSIDEPVLLNMALNLYERIIGQGFDTAQPIGLVLQTDGIVFYPIAFTPLNLNSEMGRSFQKQYAEQLPDGRTVIRQEVFNWPLGRLFVQEHNGWAFIAPENLLNTLPDDPTTLLQGLDRDALIAARFDLQNLPSLTTRAVLSLGEMNAVAQAESEIDKALVRLNIGYIRSLAEQADFLEYTFSYDEELNEYVFTQKEIVKPNTERARLMQERRNAESRLHGFYHPTGAILASHFVMSLTQTQREQLEIILDEAIGKHLLTEEERSADAPEYRLNDLTDTPLTDAQKLEMLLRRIGATYYWGLVGAIRSGQFDGASTWSQERGILAAYNIVEGERFQRAFDNIFEEMQTNFPDLYAKNVEKDYAEFEGFSFTSVTFRLGDFIKNPFLQSITPPRLAAREMLLILAVREDAVCFAIGQGAQPEWMLVNAITGMSESKPVEDLFFFYSAYELGQAFAVAGQPSRFERLKLAAAETNPLAWAFAYSNFTDTTKTITFRASGLLTPSLWRMREAMR